MWASETQSMTTYADAYPLSRDTMTWFMGHYMGAEADPADPRLSPIKTEDLSGLAPAVVVTAVSIRWSTRASATPSGSRTPACR
jgi:acetyl esterase